jgi:hypothetical protein
MAKNPSSVWYWNDWLLDPGVRMCSMAARGFWLEMLAIAAAATPYGHVVVNGQPCSVCDLATATKQRKQDVSRWIRELEKRGVFSRTEDGTIFCRRMVREAEARREKASHRGKASPPRVAHPQRDTKQPDLLDNPPPKTEKRADSDSDSVAVSQDSPSTSKPLPESLDAPRAREGKSENNEKGNPEGGRCAPLGGERLAAKTRMPARWSSRHRDGECDELPSQAPASDNRDLAHPRQDHGHPISRGRSTGNGWPSPSRPPPKSPALKAKIRAQLQQKHARYLQARRRPDELAAYWAAQLNDDPIEAQRVFDAVDRQMRCAGWREEWCHG